MVSEERRHLTTVCGNPQDSYSLSFKDWMLRTILVNSHLAKKGKKGGFFFFALFCQYGKYTHQQHVKYKCVNKVLTCVNKAPIGVNKLHTGVNRKCRCKQLHRNWILTVHTGVNGVHRYAELGIGL